MEVIEWSECRRGRSIVGTARLSSAVVEATDRVVRSPVAEAGRGMVGLLSRSEDLRGMGALRMLWRVVLTVSVVVGSFWALVRRCFRAILSSSKVLRRRAISFS